MTSPLPPLRALQAFEAFGRLGTVRAAAQDLGVTAGAISQHLKTLEDFTGITLLVKEGRRAVLTPQALVYHAQVQAGFDRLRTAQDVLSQHDLGVDLKVSGLPTLLLKWLNPQLHLFRSGGTETPIWLEATHREPEPQMRNTTFRLTYGAVSARFPHRQVLFTDLCFPVCAPEFLARFAQARDPSGLAGLPLIEIDWGAAYASVPHWRHWFAARGQATARIRPVAVHSLSSSALEAAAAGQGVALAQLSFAAADLELGRLVRLSAETLPMPEPYYVCWGADALARSAARDFLTWLIQTARGVHRKQFRKTDVIPE